MSREEDRVLRQTGWKPVRSDVMSVSCEVCGFSGNQIYVIGKDGEFEDHLIDLGIAVAAHGEDGRCHGIKKGDDLFRLIVGGKIVSRAVIKNIA
jgi:hypothetical protein